MTSPSDPVRDPADPRRAAQDLGRPGSGPLQPEAGLAADGQAAEGREQPRLGGLGLDRGMMAAAVVLFAAGLGLISLRGSWQPIAGAALAGGALALFFTAAYRWGCRYDRCG